MEGSTAEHVAVLDNPIAQRALFPDDDAGVSWLARVHTVLNDFQHFLFDSRMQR
jgi:hypothetical protein